MNPIVPTENRRLVETSIDKTSERIEAVKNLYWDSKVALYGALYSDIITQEEKEQLPYHLKNTLTCCRWLLEVISSKVEADDEPLRKNLYNYFTKYRLLSGEEDILFEKLHEFDFFIKPYIDNWKHEEALL